MPPPEALPKRIAALSPRDYTVACQFQSSIWHAARKAPISASDIAFITANYNTLQCIERLAFFFGGLNVPFPFSFTVVDNSSFDGSREFLQSSSGINYLQTGENLGYGRAINRGVAATASKYICVLNSDVVLNRNALVQLWRFMEEHPEAGVAAPRITYADGREQGMVFKPLLFSHYAEWFAKLVAWLQKWKTVHASAPLHVDGVMGAFFLIRRSMVPQPTLFDEDFFFFYEDSALAHTLKNRGVPCYVLPDLSIIHIGGQSRSPSSISFFFEGRYLYLQKFYGAFHAKAVYFFDRFRTLRKWFLYSLLSLFTSSGRIKSKQRHYQLAWSNVPPKS
jgi:GT2 family glycosyltransferase